MTTKKSPTDPVTLRTERLILRPWQPADADPFARLNADPEVMAHYPTRLTRAQSDEQMRRLARHITENGWGLWAVEVADSDAFIGYCGLWPAAFDAHFTPAIEIGWRTARPFWGKSYAFEAAQAAMQFGFDTLELAEIVSFTIPANLRSQRLMQRLGMTRNPADDFEHPRLPVGHPMRPHVLYRLSRDRYNTNWADRTASP